jgi:hypothetical protein
MECDSQMKMSNAKIQIPNLTFELGHLGFPCCLLLELYLRSFSVGQFKFFYGNAVFTQKGPGLRENPEVKAFRSTAFLPIS